MKSCAIRKNSRNLIIMNTLFSPRPHLLLNYDIVCNCQKKLIFIVQKFYSKKRHTSLTLSNKVEREHFLNLKSYNLTICMVKVFENILHILNVWLYAFTSRISNIQIFGAKSKLHIVLSIYLTFLYCKVI